MSFFDSVKKRLSGWMRRSGSQTVIVRDRAVAANVLDSVAVDDDIALWQFATGEPADRVTSRGNRDTARRRCRSVYLNNSYAKGAARLFGVHVIGGDGPVLQLLKSPLMPKEDADYIEQAWWDWCQQVDLPTKLQLCVVAPLYENESFLRFVYDPYVPGSELNVVNIEVDRVTSPYCGMEDEYNVDGIQFDEYGHPIWYSVLKTVPNPNYQYNIEYETVPAHEMIHFFYRDLVGQHRGLAQYQTSVKLFRLLQRYTLATIDAAELAADYAGIIKTDLPPEGVASEYDSSQATMTVPRKTLKALPEGWDVSQLKAEQPTQQYGDFKGEICGEIGASINMPKGILKNDSSDANYSSAQADKGTYYVWIDTVQKGFSRTAMNPAFDLWIQAEASSDDRINAILDRHDRKPWKIRREWGYPRPISADPTKDVDASKAMIDAQISSRRIESAKWSRDFTDIANDLREEDALLGGALPQQAEPSGNQQQANPQQNEQSGGVTSLYKTPP